MAAEQTPEDGQWMAEHRYRAVLEVRNGAPITEVAARYGTSRQSVHAWRTRFEQDGIAGLQDRSRRPLASPHRLAADVEALVCELRRAHPRWGARRLVFELGQRGVEQVPSRATVHRVLVRGGLVTAQAQRHKRKYKRWQREAPMHLWQLDLVGGIYLADGRECKMLTGIDDHSRYLVVAAVLAFPNGRAVCEAFEAAMGRHGIPSEVLTDNGKQFTGRFTKPRPAEVLFEQVCRHNGITARLTKPRSPTTTGKIERFHATLRRELLDEAGPFADLPAAQAAIDAWVHSYNHARPHQALDMAVPASVFRPRHHDTARPTVLAASAPSGAADPAKPDAQVSKLVLPDSGHAVEFDTVIAASGLLSVIPVVQRIKMGKELAGRTAHVWVDQLSAHILCDGELIKTVPSNLSANDLHELMLRGAQPAGAPPATPATARLDRLAAGAAIELDRSVGGDGFASLDGQQLNVGTQLARQRVTLRIDGHLIHVIAGGVLARTLPSPISADHARRLRGARLAAKPLPAPPAGPVRVERRVPRDGVIMVNRQSIRVGGVHAGKIVTIVVEDTHLRVLLNGEELCVHPRAENRPVTRFKAYAARQPEQ